MKKLLTLFFLFLTSFSFSQAEKTFSVKGQIEGMPDKTEISLKGEGMDEEPLFTVLSTGNEFEVTTKLQSPGLYQLTAKGTNQKLAIFLDGSSVVIKGTWSTFQQSTVTGSASHNDYIAFNTEFNPLFSKLSSIAQLLNKGEKDENGTLRKSYADIVTDVNDKVDSYIASHRESPVSSLVILVVMQLSDDPSVIEKRYAAIAETAKNNYFGKMVQQLIEEAKFAAVGTEAPDFVQQDQNGKGIKLSSFRGKYVLIDFWASWCGPCRQENPNVVNAFKKYKEKNFTVLGVSLDRSKDPWLKAIADDGLTWTQVSDLKFWNNAVAVQYKVQSIPQNLLIDPNGIIVAKNLRGEQLQSKLAALLK
ncbi:MAG: AhpC/TSA family protein [Bacteroidetes bacterium]|nr:AhpC/TSA family protein [Bacteroidota bacterium]